MQLTIRDQSPAGESAIRYVLLAAFPTPAEADLVERLRENDRISISLVANQNGEIVGHIAFSPLTINEEPTSGLGLAPVAVLPSHQSQGIGGQLIEAGVKACRNAEADFVVVLGEPEYYHRFGFRRASDFGLQNEYGVDEPFMALELTEGSLDEVSGLVKYAPEFGELE